MENNPLNILIISCDWRNIYQTGFAELKRKLQRDQLNPDLNHFQFFSWSTTSYEQKDGRYETVHIKTRWRFFRPFIDVMTYFVAPKVVKRQGWKPDIIFVFDFGFLPAAKLLQKIVGGKIVLCLTNMPQIYSETRKFGALKSLYSRFIERRFIHLPDIYYTINTAMKEYVLSLGARPDDTYVFASNTITRDIEHIKKAQKGLIRQKYTIAPEKKMLLSVGRLEAEKGFPELFRLFAALSKDHVLVVLGQGSLLTELQQLAEKLGIADRVHFAGYVGREGIWNYHLDADAFVLLSRAEALGLVFWEAMYMGVPVIGSTAPGIVESVGKSGDRGFIYDTTESVEQFQKLIHTAVTPSKERDELILRAKAYVEKEISNPLTINDLVKEETGD